jgi:polyisoprenoid-binding protein YceI
MFVCLTTTVFCQYQPIDKGSKVGFKIKNLGFTVDGSFTGLSGKIVFDPQNVVASSFSVNVDAATVNTDNSLRDEHLRGESYLDVKDFPKISFVSTKVTRTNKTGVLMVYGRLTIKSVSRDISMPFTAVPASGGYIFKGSFNVNRREFNVGGASIISDGLTVDLEVFAR